MGYYIQVPHIKGKAQQIVNLHGGRIIHKPLKSFTELKPDEALICIVENDLFEAAALCYSEDELQYFSRDDGRPKDWLIMDKTLAHELAHYSD